MDDVMKLAHPEDDVVGIAPNGERRIKVRIELLFHHEIGERAGERTGGFLQENLEIDRFQERALPDEAHRFGRAFEEFLHLGKCSERGEKVGANKELRYVVRIFGNLEQRAGET
jgi:hypothetical protein